MKKVLIICAGGMSSSLIAKLICEKLQETSNEFTCDFSGVYEARSKLEKNEYDLFLESPQVRFLHDFMMKYASVSQANLVQIPPFDYVPVPKRITNLSRLILDNID